MYQFFSKIDKLFEFFLAWRSSLRDLSRLTIDFTFHGNNSALLAPKARYIVAFSCKRTTDVSGNRLTHSRWTLDFVEPHKASLGFAGDFSFFHPLPPSECLINIHGSASMYVCSRMCDPLCPSCKHEENEAGSVLYTERAFARCKLGRWREGEGKGDAITELTRPRDFFELIRKSSIEQKAFAFFRVSRSAFNPSEFHARNRADIHKKIKSRRELSVRPSFFSGYLLGADNADLWYARVFL